MDIHPIIEEDLNDIIDCDIKWQKLRNSTVLITGASGMIASYIVYTLLYLNEKRNMNIKVIGLVRNKNKAVSKYGELLRRDDFSIVAQDVNQKLVIEGKIDFIFHAASQASPRKFIEDPVGTIKANSVGTINMLELGIEKEIAGFVYLSTREIYGEFTDGCEFVGENDYGVVNPSLVRSCYPESKRLSENLCISYKHQFSLNTKIARIAHTYGPGITINDGRVIGDFVGNIINNEDIALNSDGSVVLSLTYLSDTVSGIFFLLLNSNNVILNLSSKKNIFSVKQFAQELINLLPEKNLKLSFREVSQKREMGYLKNKIPLLDSQEAVDEGWQEKVNIKCGFKKLITFLSEV